MLIETSVAGSQTGVQTGTHVVLYEYPRYDLPTDHCQWAQGPLALDICIIFHVRGLCAGVCICVCIYVSTNTYIILLYMIYTTRRRSVAAYNRLRRRGDR
jgi:hypothetical protein